MKKRHNNEANRAKFAGKYTVCECGSYLLVENEDNAPVEKNLFLEAAVRKIKTSNGNYLVMFNKAVFYTNPEYILLRYTSLREWEWACDTFEEPVEEIIEFPPQLEESTMEAEMKNLTEIVEKWDISYESLIKIVETRESYLCWGEWEDESVNLQYEGLGIVIEDTDNNNQTDTYHISVFTLKKYINSISQELNGVDRVPVFQ